MQFITRKGSFDAGHRVMNERMKCFNVHGHTYLYELDFGFNIMEDIGYAIDFKEIKRVGCQWIEDYLDHGMIINPHDKGIIDLCDNLGSKKWLMSLNGENEYCNPSAENIAKEMFLAMEILFEDYKNFWIGSIKLYETPNCYTVCCVQSISEKERENFTKARAKDLRDYKNSKGVVEYDDRKV